MDKAVVYIHGKGGNAGEAEHYKPLFADSDVIGFDYAARTPWDAKAEFAEYFDALRQKYQFTEIIANSIGAFFAMHALANKPIRKAYFISPVVDMAKLISDMMTWANVTEDDLRRKREIQTNFGETLSYEYLCYAKAHPVEWTIPTRILYGEKDNLTPYETISAFSTKTNAPLTVMENGEHWFHTDEQMRFLDEWLKRSAS